MSLNSFYWKTRTLISGDYREIERNTIAMKNRSVIKKYRGKKDIYGVIRIHTDEGGLFCLYLKVVGGIHYCIENDLIPVVDMQTKYNIFQTKEERRKLNTWELYFKQPAGKSYDEIKKCKNKVIIENPTGPGIDSFLLENDTGKKYWKTIVSKFIILNDKMNELVHRHSEVFFDGSKTLGLLIRGTDYKRDTAWGHGIQPSVDEVISEVKEVIKENGYTKIFLASEDQKLYTRIVDEFGDKVYSIPQKRFDENITDKLGHKKEYADYAKDMNASYLASIVMLSKCDGFIAGMTGGSFGVWLMSNNFEYMHIYNKGSYGMFDDETCNLKKIEDFESKL